MRDAWPWLIAVGIVGCVLSGKAIAKDAPSPVGLILLAASLISAILLHASWRLARTRTWSEIAGLAAAASVVTALSVFVVAAPANSPACSSSNGDCDTSFGLGLPFVTAAFFVPEFTICAAPKVTTAALVRRGARRT